MKKFNASFISLLLVLSVITALSPINALAKDSGGEKDKKENHGFFVRMVAKTKSIIGSMGNHGSAVKETAKSEYGKKLDDENDNDNEDNEKSSTTPPVTTDTKTPTLLFSTVIGLNASTTRILWLTNESSIGKIWVNASSSISTSTVPTITADTFGYFHIMNIPNLATSTKYYYVISSADASGNISYYSDSFTSPSN